MKTRAAVAFEAKQPLEIIELDLEAPQLPRLDVAHWQVLTGQIVGGAGPRFTWRSRGGWL